MRMQIWLAAVTAALLAAGGLRAQTEMSIAEMQQTGAFGPDSSGLCGELVTVEGIVLSSSAHFYSGSHSSFYLIDENGGDYSGVLIFHPDGDVFDTYVGDRLRITGTVEEYRTESGGVVSNMTEIVPTVPETDVELLGIDQPLPDPVYVDMWYLDPVRHNEHVAEIYEGMLVEIVGAVVVDVSAPPSWRQFTVADEAGNQCVIRTAAATLNDYGRPPLGSSFELIRGVIYQVYGNYNVMPRHIDDLILAVGPPVISGVTLGPCGATPSELLTVACNISDNTAVDEAFVGFRTNGGAWTEYVLVRDLVNPVRFTTDLPAQPEGSLVEIYIWAVDDEFNESHHPVGGPEGEGFPMIYVTAVQPTDCATIQQHMDEDGGSLYICHEATLTGTITMGAEDFGFSEEDTYRNYMLQDASGRWNAIYLYNNSSHDVWLPDLQRGDLITVSGEVVEYNGLTELSYLSAFELHSGGNLVEPTTISLAGDFAGDEESWESVLIRLEDVTVTGDAGFGEWHIQDGSGGTIILDNLGVWDHALSVGATMDGLTGVVTYNFNAWKIVARDNADFESLNGLQPTQRPADIELLSAWPNPFNPETTLRFELSSPGRTRLSVHNLLGQTAAVLIDGPIAAGRHERSFDASALASGVYIARLQHESGSVRQIKLLLAK
jgi:DNA/RNA endonuclease YhcR with UshA esterase domain